MTWQRAPVQSNDTQTPELDPSAAWAQEGQGALGNSFLVDLLGLGATALSDPGSLNPLSPQTGRSLALRAIPLARDGANGLIDAAADLEHGLVDGVEARAEGCSPALGAAAGWWGDRMNLCTDVLAGFGEGSVDLLADGGELLADPVGAAEGMMVLQSHLPGSPLRYGRLALEAAQGRRDPWDLARCLWDARVGAEQDGAILGATVNKLATPYVDAWEQGRPGEILGRLASQALPDLLGEGLGLQAGRAAKASGAAKVGEGFQLAPEIGVGSKEIGAVEAGADAVNAPELRGRARSRPGPVEHCARVGMAGRQLPGPPIRRRGARGCARRQWHGGGVGCG